MGYVVAGVGGRTFHIGCPQHEHAFLFECSIKGIDHPQQGILGDVLDNMRHVDEVILFLVAAEKIADIACAVKRRWSTAGASPARELGSLHPEAIGAAVEETKPSEPPV